MTYEQRCPVCRKLLYYAGDSVPGMLCECGTKTASGASYFYYTDRDQLITERDEARRWARRLYAENAALRREREITASVINQNYALTKECDMLQDELDALRHLRQKKQVRANG